MPQNFGWWLGSTNVHLSFYECRLNAWDAIRKPYHMQKNLFELFELRGCSDE